MTSREHGDVSASFGPFRDESRKSDEPHFSCVAFGNVSHFGVQIKNMAALSTTRRSSRLVARLSEEDKALLEQAAGLEGCSVAAFVVTRVREAALEVVQRHETVKLNQTESRRFVAALLAPPKAPTKRMKAGLALHRNSVTER